MDNPKDLLSKEFLSHFKTAEERKGIQPIVTLTSEAEKRKKIKRGTKVKFQAAIDLPPNSGKIVSIEWNFEGNEFSHSKSRITAKR